MLFHAFSASSVAASQKPRIGSERLCWAIVGHPQLKIRECVTKRPDPIDTCANDRLVPMNELFTLRVANPKDKPWLDSYCYAEGMANLDDIDGVTVAVNPEDEPVGFIQIAVGNNGVAHVYPIVVHASWRGRDVGRALIEDAHKRFGELRLVSRGSSIGFYEKLGFVPCDWGLIDNEQTEGCIDCSMKEECGPLPMRLLSD